MDQVLNASDQVSWAWVLAEGDPQDAVAECLPHPLVVADRPGEGGLAVAAKALQAHGNRSWRAVLVQQVSGQLIQFGRSGDKAFQLLDHEGNAQAGILGRGEELSRAQPHKEHRNGGSRQLSSQKG